MSELGCPRNSADTEFRGIFWLLKWFLRNSGEIPRNFAEFRGISPELHRKSLPYSAECQNVTSVDTLVWTLWRQESPLININICTNVYFYISFHCDTVNCTLACPVAKPISLVICTSCSIEDWGFSNYRSWDTREESEIGTRSWELRVRSQEPGVEIKHSGVRIQDIGVRRQEPGAGARSQESDSGVRS
jgi:hypothetical protein